MADQSGSTQFHLRFESALQAYQQTTSVTLADHPLTVQLQYPHSVESITTILKYEARISSGLLGCEGIVKSIESTVSILSSLSDTTPFSDVIVLPYPLAKAILPGLVILFSAAKGIDPNHGVLIDLLESIECCLRQLEAFASTPTPEIDEIVFNIILQLLSALALATKELNEGQSIKFVKKGEKDVEVALQRIMKGEVRTSPTETLEVVHSPVQNTREVIDNSKASVDGDEEDLSISNQLANDDNKSKRDKLRRDIGIWLRPPDPWKNYHIARESRYAGTGAWFLEGGTLSEWKAFGTNSVLWIHGKPGAGKSVLCSTIIEEIETMHKAGDASLAIYYYDFREDQKKDLRGLLSSILFQLSNQSDSYHDILSKFYLTNLNGVKSPSDDDLEQCLKELLEVQGQSPVYLIIDALDECPSTFAKPSPREEVLKLLVRLIETRLVDLRICVTSRRETDIKVALEPLTFRSISIHDESGQLVDIENYIKAVINTDTKSQRWKEEDKELVIESLTDRADGMFRWTYCQIEYLFDCHPGRIRHALAELPDSLDETYERTLREIKKSDSELAHRLFQCVAVASRPLSVNELAECFAFDFKTGPTPKFREDWRPEDPLGAVVSTCSLLLSVIYVDDSPIIQFSHYSVKEFLTSSRFADKSDTTSRRYHVSMTPAHTLVAQVCLGILLHLDENDDLEKFPLAEYAAEHWFEHARVEGVLQNAEEGMKELFDPRKQHFAIWLCIHDPILTLTHQEVEPPMSPKGTALHYAAFCGLHNIVKFGAVLRPQDVNTRGFHNKSTPLHLASRKGFTQVVRILIEHGARVSAKNKEGWTPLHFASASGHVEVVRLLVEHGALISAKKKDGQTPLHLALISGHLDLAWFLVEHGADVSVKDDDGWTPLRWAMINCPSELARFFVEHGADVSAKDNDGRTLLHWAVERRQMDLAQFLVEHDAHVSAQDNDGLTPLRLAVQSGDVALVRLLAKNGADASAQDKRGWSTLRLAVERGNEDLARLLIEHSADLSAKDNEGRTPLRWAMYRRRFDLARFLIEHGADMSAKDNDGRTPLGWALEDDDEDFVRMLVEQGADLSAKDKDGRTPLRWAMERNHIDLASTLLEKGADVSISGNNGWNPLQWASSNSHMDLARALVKHGADLSVEDSDGWGPLHRATLHGHLGFMQILVEHGVDISARDKNGYTPLHWALVNGRLDLAQFLVEHGADASAKDNSGDTPLHRASERGYVDLAQILIERGADVSAKTKYGRTPLHGALTYGNLDMARVLLEHGADVSVKRDDGRTPLHQAAELGSLALAQLLIEHGADVSVRDKNRSTPLHLASQRGHSDLARFLVERSADPIA